MTTLIGHLPHFSTECDDWIVFCEQLEQYFEINNINNEKKAAVLLTSLAGNVYKILQILCHPEQPKTKTFDELIELLSKQFVVRKTLYCERVAFYSANQGKYESVKEWHTRIRRQSTNCKFEDRLDDILLDRFISGLKSVAILNRLCEEKEGLTLQKAVEIAMDKESVEKASES